MSSIEGMSVVLFCDRDIRSNHEFLGAMKMALPGRVIYDCVTVLEAQGAIEKVDRMGQKIETAFLEADFLTDVPRAIVDHNPTARIAVFSFLDRISTVDVLRMEARTKDAGRILAMGVGLSLEVLSFVRDLSEGRRKEMDGVVYQAFFDKRGGFDVFRDLVDFVVGTPIGASLSAVGVRS